MALVTVLTQTTDKEVSVIDIDGDGHLYSNYTRWLKNKPPPNY